MDELFSKAGGERAQLGGKGADFTRFAAVDARALIAEYPLALVSAKGEDAPPSLLPLVARCDEADRVVALIGHMSRRNPLAAAFGRRKDAEILFTGPQAYVSPEVAGLRNWAPTWNYALLRVEGRLELDTGLTEESLQVLVAAMEEGKVRPWATSELGDRYDAMKQEIIGFTVEVTGVSGRFKLGQDESDEVVRNIVDHLPDAAMVRWMRRFNEGRT